MIFILWFGMGNSFKKYVATLRFNLILIIFLGFLVSILTSIAIQDGLYNSQIVLDIIDYKDTDLMKIWGENLWTILAQVSGLLIKIGLSELTVSLLISCFTAIVSFLGIFLIASSFLSPLFSTLLTLTYFLSTHYIAGLHYEVSMISWSSFNSTWGQYGFHMSMITIGLILHRNKYGYIFLGLLPSIHFFQGSFLLGSIALTFLFNKEIFCIKMSKYFAYGLLVSVISFLFNYLNTPYIDMEPVLASYIDYVNSWDSHRSTEFSLFHPSIIITCFTVLSCLVKFKESIRHRFLSLYLTMAFCSLSLVVICRFITIDSFARLMLALPTRFVNITCYLSLVVLAYMLVKYFEKPRIITYFLIFLVSFQFVPYGSIYYYLSALIIFLVPVFKFTAKIKIHKTVGYISTFLILLGFSYKLYVLTNLNERLTEVKEHFNEPVMKFLKKEPSRMLLISSSYVGSEVQLLSRRPILIDVSELAEVSYAFHTYNKSNQIIRDIYGFELTPDYASLFISYRETETIDPEYVRRIWEQRSPEEWKILAHKYDFYDILCPSEWNLKLDHVFNDKNHKVYRVSELDILSF